MFGSIKKTLCIICIFTANIMNFCPINIINATESNTTTTTYYTPYKQPIVVLHGLESSSQEMIPFCNWLGSTFNTDVYNMEIGNGKQTSMYTSLNNQLAELCVSIYTIGNLEKGFNFIGISQGGLLARGYVEHCNSYPVINLITLVSPNGGIFWKNSQTNGLMYTKFTQNHFSVASYWRNPNMLNYYLTSSSYLAVLNNEFWTIESPIHRDNIRKLANFVMVWSSADQVLSPPESGKFSFYDAQFNIIPLEQTQLYKNDDLGLKYLNNKNSLHIYETNCSHIDHRNPVCYNQLYKILKHFL